MTEKEIGKIVVDVAVCRLGFLLNFNEVLMKNGIHRCVNGLPDNQTI